MRTRTENGAPSNVRSAASIHLNSSAIETRAEDAPAVDYGLNRSIRIGHALQDRAGRKRTVRTDPGQAVLHYASVTAVYSEIMNSIWNFIKPDGSCGAARTVTSWSLKL